MLVLTSCLDFGGGPKIEEFRADPSSVSAGQTVMLSWQVADSAGVRLSLEAEGNGSSGSVTRMGEVSGQSGMPVTVHRTTTYRLIASGPLGVSSREVTVTVQGDGSGGGPGTPLGEGILLLVAGQSNASGNGLEQGGSFPSAETEQPVDGVWMLTADRKWVRAAEPTHPGGKHSFLLRLGKELRAATSEQVYLIPAAEGGSLLSEWQPGKTLFEEAVADAKWAAADRGVAVTAVMWFQGESDTKWDYTRRDFITNTDNVLQGFRSQLPGEPPTVFAQLAKRLYDPNKESSAKGHNLAYQEVREKQRLMEAGAKQLSVGQASPGGSTYDRPHYFMVVTHDLPMSDDKHVSAAGQRTLGERFANSFLTNVWGGGAGSGIGPRLEAVTYSGNSITVDTTQPLNESSSYDGYFTVFVDGRKVDIAGMGLDPNDRTAIVITTAQPLSGDVRVRYMPPDEYGLYSGSNQAVHSSVGGFRLPLPAFGGPVEPIPEGMLPGMRAGAG